VRKPLGWRLSREDVLRLVREDAHPVALFGDWAGGADVVASEPLLVRATRGSLEDVFDAPDPAGADAPGAVDANGTCVFGGGWIGYLGYSAGGEALQVSAARRLHACWFGYYDHVLRRDRRTGEWVFEALWTQDRSAALTGRLAELERRAATAPPRREGFWFGAFRLTPGAAGHQAAVAKTVDYIRAGDIFQANICLRAEAEFTGDPLDAFCQAAADLQPPYAAFIGVSASGGGAPGLTRAAVASLSPELFLRRTGDTVVSKPIKGTARRPADQVAAAAQLAELERSVKNRAENVMIVDLVRNDLSRVCVPGSVKVPVLLGAEPHPGVWHLVSTVEGTMEPGRSDGDLIRASFPPGSVTGAPKVRALEIIDELEAAPREVYTGAVGFRSPLAGLELNVAIRTFEFAPATPKRPARAWLGAGGGIVADSDPAAEYAECLIKATPLVTALGADLDTEAAEPAAAEVTGTGLLAATESLRPHATVGVFTSLKVTAGQTRDLGAHLSRLEASVRDLYGKDLPASLHADLAATLASKPTGRLRVTIRPVGGPLQPTVEVVPLPSAPAAPPGASLEITARGAAAAPATVALRPAVVPGGVGAHKYRDRRLIDDLGRRAGLGAGEQLLLTDETGELLETDRANVFAVIDGVLLTPPADGRLLPGVTRAATLRAARGIGVRTGQKPLTLGELAEATEVFVTNSVAGLLPVRAIDGLQLCWVPGPVTARLATALAARPDDGHLPPATSSVGRSAAGAFGGSVTRRSPLVILIDNYDSFTFNLAHLIEVAGCHVEVVRNDEVTAAQVSAAAPDGVVISPGPCAPAEAGISIDVVRACAATATALLGICLGHQAIGAAFGADIIRAPRPVHGTAYPVAHDGAGVLAGLPDPFPATRYHSLIVDERTLPEDLLISARTGPLPMALRHAALPIEGVQFHPESILTPHGAQLIRNFTAICAQTIKPARP
jgi:para-aminobenzoate synthetase/4-amino-4-deoxychorismate lyase